MAVRIQREILCEECKTPLVVDVCVSINAKEDGALVDRMKDGSLLRYKCSECGALLNVIDDFMYHDIDNKIMIKLVPGAGIEDITKINLLADAKYGDGLLKRSDVFKGYHCRVVGTLSDLNEKVEIYKRGYDDRTMELLKQSYIDSAKEDDAGIEIDEARFEVAKDGTNLVVFYKDGKYVADADFDAEWYKELSETYEIKSNTTEYQLIDSQWAINTLRR